MLAMVLYPEAQRKAQEELDAIVGRSRPPTFDDLDSLVYIHAIVKEILRWHPVDPLGECSKSTRHFSSVLTFARHATPIDRGKRI